MKIGRLLYWLRWITAIPVSLAGAAIVSYIIHITLTLMLYMMASVYWEKIEIVYYLLGPYVFLFVFHSFVPKFKIKLSRVVSGILFIIVLFTAIYMYLETNVSSAELFYSIYRVVAGIISIALFNYLLGQGKIRNIFAGKE